MVSVVLRISTGPAVPAAEAAKKMSGARHGRALI
jgi:hypothetical protein